MKKLLFVIIAVFMMTVPAYAMEEDINLLENEGEADFPYLEELLDKLADADVIAKTEDGYDLDKNETVDVSVDGSEVTVLESNSIEEKAIIEIPDSVKESMNEEYDECPDSLRFRINECKVTFYPRNGENDFSVYVTRGQSVARPEDPTDSKYAFMGWTTNDTLEEDVDFSRKINLDEEFYAKWAIPFSVCSYDNSEQEPCQGGKFRMKHEDGWDDRPSYGGNNYMLSEVDYSTIELKAYPDNGYDFVGWYYGRYIGGDSQACEPYINDANLITTDPELELDFYEDAIVCPVFKKANLINFVDIGTIWTDLDASKEIPFTGEVNPNEEGLDEFIEISDEIWTDEDGNEISKKEPKKPIGGMEYYHTIKVKAKGNYKFAPEFRFIFGGHEFDWSEAEDMIEFDNKDKEITDRKSVV